MPVTLNNLGIVFSDSTSMTTDEIPVNTRTVFANTSAPSGWTRLTGIDTFNDSMLRLNYATGGSSGGSGALSFGANVVPYHTHTYTTTGASVQHIHNVLDSGHWHITLGPGGGNQDSGLTGPYYKAPVLSTSSSGNGSATQSAAGTHGHTGTLTSQSTSGVWIPRYVDVLICYKN